MTWKPSIELARSGEKQGMMVRIEDALTPAVEYQLAMIVMTVIFFERLVISTPTFSGIYLRTFNQLYSHVMANSYAIKLQFVTLCL